MSFSGHLHTLFAHFIPSAMLPDKGEQHFISLEDGERIAGYYHPGTSEVLVSLFHGLTGDIHADYMQRTALQYLAKGHSVFLVNHRGVDAEAGPTKTPYHSGRGEDVSSVISYLRKTFPTKKQIAVGFSMSGNMLLLLLSGQKGQHLPDAAITVNAPIDLGSCSRVLSRGFNRVYDLRFVKRLIERNDLQLSRWSRVLDIDDQFTAPLCGFKNGQDYYDKCSTKPHLCKIKTPTCVLTAADDPFIPVQDYREASWPDSIELTIRARGGHLGYLRRGRNTFGNHRWLDEYLVEKLDFLIQLLFRRG